MFHLTPENIPYLYFSQTGEDQLVLSYLPKNDGFFVDVGAHHPFQYSNTFSLYLRGWRGINIEPNPEVIELFTALRPEDIHLNLGVSKSVATLDYIKFNNPLCNTFSKKFTDLVMRHDSGYQLSAKTDPILTKPLRNILDESLPQGKKIDLLNVDAEGMDLEVLESSDWSKYRPTLVLVEDHDFNIEAISQSQIYQFMKKKHYAFVAKTLSTLLFYAEELHPPKFTAQS